MSFQLITQNQTSMDLSYRRVVGQSVTRGGYIRTAEYSTTIPWQVTINCNNLLRYSTNRSLIATIDKLDRSVPDTVQFSDSITTNGAKLSWIVSYQGSLTNTQLNALTLTSYNAVAGTIVLSNVPTLVIAGTTLFKAGDFIQLPSGSSGERYVYKVVNDVPLSASTTQTVQLHRQIIGSPSTTGGSNNVRVGDACIFKFLALQLPTYGFETYQNNDAFIRWTGPFVLQEYIIG